MRVLRSVLISGLVLMFVTVPLSDALGQEPSASPGPTGPSSLQLSVRGSPLIADRDGARIEIVLRLDAPVDDFDLRVLDFGGSKVKQLARGPRRAGSLRRSWNGRDERDNEVPSGAYRIVAMTSEGGVASSAEEWITLADRRVYPRRPGYITVAVDPGHGGSLDGAVGRDGTREADINLDIGLRLARLLEGAGVNVVLTRTTDSNVNEPPQDLTGDGVIDDTDELAARTDLANKARADVYVSVHNNVAVNESVGGPSTFYADERPFTDRSSRLARIVQAAVADELARFESESWSVFDHGALIYPYYVLRAYDPPRLQRPTQMPGVLSEGLFLSNPTELRLLKWPAVRQAIANAYYDAIATYLSRRATHVGYELVDGPTEAVAGDVVEYEVEVRNQGNEVMRGWRLSVGALPAPFMYEGQGRAGQLAGEGRIPRLEPGESTSLVVKVTAPQPGADWMLLFDARDRDGKRASRRGSPPLQVLLESVDPEPVPLGSAVPPGDRIGRCRPSWTSPFERVGGVPATRRR
ncbi:MAG: N-acetylmuramoyl-L-alanine amidase [Chloroflexota bacterium]